MTLKEYLLQMPEGEEVTVWDNTYDMETYFYNQTGSAWDDAMMDLADKLNVVDVHNDGVVVDLYELIERNLSNISGLFYDPDVEIIMDDMESILAGNISEDWFDTFVHCLV